MGPTAGGNRAFVFGPDATEPALVPDDGITLLDETSAIDFEHIETDDYLKARERWAQATSPSVLEVGGSGRRPAGRSLRGRSAHWLGACQTGSWHTGSPRGHVVTTVATGPVSRQPRVQPVEIHKSFIVAAPFDAEPTCRVEPAKVGMAVTQDGQMGIGIGRCFGGPTTQAAPTRTCSSTSAPPWA
jgi:hypothetical protein